MYKSIGDIARNKESSEAESLRLNCFAFMNSFIHIHLNFHFRFRFIPLSHPLLSLPLLFPLSNKEEHVIHLLLPKNITQLHHPHAPNLPLILPLITQPKSTLSTFRLPPLPRLPRQPQRHPLEVITH